MEWLRDIIREAIGTLSKPKPFQLVQPDYRKFYLPRDKMISLGIKYINKYGFLTPHDNEKTTYERLINAINRDPSLMNVEVDAELVNEFLTAMRGLTIKAMGGGLFMQKARILLHGPNINLAQAYYVLYAISFFLEHKRKENSKEAESDVVLTVNAQLIGVNLNTKKESESQTYDFVDKKGIFYRKFGSPPPIYLRSKIGSKKKLADEPYEMFYNDRFVFKAKVASTYTNSRGYVVNIIKNIRPIV